MNEKKEILFLNDNYNLRNFDIFINGKKIKEENSIKDRKHFFKGKVDSDCFKISLKQRHPCDKVSSMLFEAMGYLLLDFLYDSHIKGECRAVYEGEVTNSFKINVELIKEKGKGRKDTYKFKVLTNSGEIIESKNTFQSEEKLKKRWKWFTLFTYLFPAALPILLLILVIIFAVM